MGLFKRASKLFHKASDAGQKLFKKGEVGGQKIFGKGSIGSKVLAKTSKGLGAVGSAVGSAGRVVNMIANNPLVGATLSSMGPYGEAALAGAKGLGAGLKGVSQTAKLGSSLTKQKNYSGDAGQVAGNILEKAKATHDAGAGISFV